MKTIRTISCKLQTVPAQVEHIEQTLKAFANACNYVSQYGQKHKISNQFKLQRGCYKIVREKFGLSANLAVRAIARVAVCLRAKKNSLFRPTSIDYDARIFTYKESDNLVSLTLLYGRSKFFLDIGKYQRNALRGKKPTSATLCKKHNGYFLDIQIKEDSPEPLKPKGMLGVDLGVKNIATTSTGRIFSSQALNSYRIKRHKIRKSLQSKAAKGKHSTRKNCRRILKRLSGKESRAAKNINHTISKRIIDEAKESELAIALENLTGIRERTNKRLRRSQRGLHNSWSFYQLKSMILYKAQRAGVPVVQINPRYTSLMCSSCLHAGIRRGSKFFCSNCGNISDADLNAAQNIAAVGAVSVNPLENSRLACPVSFACA